MAHAIAHKTIVSAEELLCISTYSLAQGAPFSFVVRGYSMMPTILDRDRVTVVSAMVDNTCVGDVVLCRTDFAVALHRVVAKINSPSGCYLEVAGDGESLAQRARCRDLVGKVIHVERRSLAPRRSFAHRVLRTVRRLLIHANRRRTPLSYSVSEQRGQC